MIDSKYVHDNIVSNARWFESHGAGGGYLGMGAMYYALPYSLRAERCVCLGSGGGFVPRLMVEAQRDLVALGMIGEVNVTLIDAGDGGTSGEQPSWSEWFFDNYPEVKLIRGLTDDVVDQIEWASYLHVDADHSYDHAMSDLKNYGAKLRGDWAITMHDTWNTRGSVVDTWRAVQDYASDGVGVVNFRVGCGTALIMPRSGS